MLFRSWEMSGKLRDQTDQRLRHASKNIGMTILEGLTFLQTEMEAIALPYAVRPGKSLFGTGNPSGAGMRQRFLGMTLYRGETEGDTLFGMPCPLPPLTEATRMHLAVGQSILRVQGIDGAPPRIFMALAVDGTSPERGVLVGEIHPNYLRYMVGNAMPVEGNVTVLDSAGASLYSSAPLPVDVTGRVVDQMKRSISGQFEWRWEGDPYLVNYRSVFLKAV